MAEFESLLVFGCLAPVRPCNHTHAYQATRRALRMSALGHKQTSRSQITMSAIPPKADIRLPFDDVRYGPEADINQVIYSITKSARNSSAGVIVKPIALAVFRLTISSNLDGCSIGSSAGFAPRRTLSTRLTTCR
jgi:hypothetical protein